MAMAVSDDLSILAFSCRDKGQLCQAEIDLIASTPVS